MNVAPKNFQNKRDPVPETFGGAVIWPVFVDNVNKVRPEPLAVSHYPVKQVDEFPSRAVPPCPIFTDGQNCVMLESGSKVSFVDLNQMVENPGNGTSSS